MFRTDPAAGLRRHHRDPHHRTRYSDPASGLRDLLRGPRWGRGLVRRGEIRPLILAALASKPMHGYEVIQELEARSGGRWRPSAGSVYPTLQQLADEGLVTSDEVDGRRVYTLTDGGRAAAAATPAVERWDGPGADGDPDLGELRRFVGAVMQVQRVGSPAARLETARLLADARRQIYRLLAEDGAAVGEALDEDEPLADEAGEDGPGTPA